jgi:hypothetical protein
MIAEEKKTQIVDTLNPDIFLRLIVRSMAKQSSLALSFPVSLIIALFPLLVLVYSSFLPHIT